MNKNQSISLNQPIKQTLVSCNSFQEDNLYVVTVAIQGWRKYMEDRSIQLKIAPNNYLFAVLDGHGGAQVAVYVSKYLPRQLKNQPNFILKKYTKALQNTFKRIDQMLVSQRGQQEIRKIQKQLRLSVTPNNQVCCFTSGCTANVVLLTPEKILTANIGDSRSVLCKSNQALDLSRDHKPTNEYESCRIKKAGGKIKNGRINNGPNFSRAFGDYEFKSNAKKPYNEQMITSIPEIMQFQKSPQDQFIFIASDGVWDNFKTKNQLLVNKVLELSKERDCGVGRRMQFDRLMMDQFIKGLVADYSEADYGCDNMTGMLIRLNEKKQN